MNNKKEMSQLQRQLLSGGGAVTLFTQQEFDDALDEAKGEIMLIAMQTAKQAVELEREECAKVAEAMERERFNNVGDPRITEFKSYIAEAIRTRLDKKEAQNGGILTSN